MKTIHWMFAVLTVGLATFAGCKKAEQAQAYDVQGVKVNVPQLEGAFASASADAQSSVAAFKRCFRYGQYPEALAELGKLAKQPSLTADQKKLVDDLTAQTKEVLAKATAAVPGR